MLIYAIIFVIKNDMEKQKETTTLSISINRNLKDELENEIKNLEVTKNSYFDNLFRNRNEIVSLSNENESMKKQFSELSEKLKELENSDFEKDNSIKELKKSNEAKEKEIARLKKWQISDEFGAVVVFVMNSVEGVTNIDEALSYLLRPFQNKGALIPSEQDIERFKERFEND